MERWSMNLATSLTSPSPSSDVSASRRFSCPALLLFFFSPTPNANAAHGLPPHHSIMTTAEIALEEGARTKEAAATVGGAGGADATRPHDKRDQLSATSEGAATSATHDQGSAKAPQKAATDESDASANKRSSVFGSIGYNSTKAKEMRRQAKEAARKLVLGSRGEEKRRGEKIREKRREEKRRAETQPHPTPVPQTHQERRGRQDSHVWDRKGCQGSRLLLRPQPLVLSQLSHPRPFHRDGGGVGGWPVASG